MSKPLIGGLALASVLLVIGWSATPSGIDAFEVVRMGIFTFGAGLVLWNVVPGPDESLTETRPRQLRLRLLIVGVAIAVAAALAPRPWPEDLETLGHHLVSRFNRLLGGQ
jgi:hypothetical protein